MKNNKNKKKSDCSGVSEKKKALPLKAIVTALGIIAFVAGIFFVTRPAVDKERPSGLLEETRPVLPASQFSGRIALAYQYAAEIPEVIDRQFCYCYCKKNFKHKSLLTCFTDNHGAQCNICQNEVIRSHELNRNGTPVTEIKKIIDSEFGKSGHS
jgi:hypothetical protein